MFVCEEAESPEALEEGVVEGEGRVPVWKSWLVSQSGEQFHHLVVSVER